VAGSTKLRIVLLFFCVAAWAIGARAQAGGARFTGTVVDPAGRPVAGAHVGLDSAAGIKLSGTTGSDGGFDLALPAWAFTRCVSRGGVRGSHLQSGFKCGGRSTTLYLEQVKTVAEEVVVSADVGEIAIDSPDPSQKILVREELLDANPGRPGAPISIPGMPSKRGRRHQGAAVLCSGVAGDHGEPIAQYIAVGNTWSPTTSPRTLMHGYADPTSTSPECWGAWRQTAAPSMCWKAIMRLTGSNLQTAPATAQLPHAHRRLSRDGSDSRICAVESIEKGVAGSGGQLWQRPDENLEHRQQKQVECHARLRSGNHEITLLSIGYWGKSHEGNLVPLGRVCR